MQSAAAVGTVQARSLVEPLRKIISRLEGHFILGKAQDLVMSERLLEVEIAAEDGGRESIYVPYVDIFLLLTKAEACQLRQVDHRLRLGFFNTRRAWTRELLPAQDYQ